MRLIVRFVIIAVMLLFAPVEGRAARGRLFTTTHQLSSSYVNQVMQDSRGYVWIASRGGLDRYDGTHMLSWHRGTLPSDNVICLVEDLDGRILVGTNHGLTAYDHSTGTFKEIRTGEGDANVVVHVTSMLVQPDGDVIITASGFGVFRLPRGKDLATHSGWLFDGSDDIVSSVYSPQDNVIWLGGGRGVYSIDTKGKVKTYMKESGTGACRVTITSSGQVIVGTSNDGLYVYDALADTFIRRVRCNGILSLCPLSDGRVAIGTNGSGAFMIGSSLSSKGDSEHDDEMLTPCQFYHPLVDLSRTNVHCMMQDRDGSLWMGLYQKGLFVQPLSTQQTFRYIGPSWPDANIIGQHGVLSLIADGDGTLWVGTDGDGLYHIDAEKNTLLRHYASGEGGMPGVVMSLALDPDGRLWVGSWQQSGGWVDRATGVFHRFPFATKENAVNVMGLAVDRQGFLWVSTGGDGLYRASASVLASGATLPVVDFGKRSAKENASVSESAQVVTHYTVAANATKTVNTIPNHWPSQLQFSSDGRLLYICMSRGVACYDIQRASFIAQFGANHVLGAHMANTMRVDRQGQLWVGTDNGLFALDSHGNTLRHYTTADGLPHNNVTSVEIDPSGHLWIGTLHGLAYMDDKGAVTAYQAADGLQEGEWSERAVCSLGDRVVMGGVNGLSIISPSARADIRSRTPSIQMVEAVLDQQMVALSESFTLPHDMGSLCLRYSAMVYDHPEDVVYMCSINGSEYTPLPSGGGVLTLSHLASGHYTVRVKAVVAGMESAPVTTEVTIRPPFYASWWAIALYAIMTVLAIWGIVTLRRNRIRQQQALQEHIHAEEMKEMKLQFFMSLNHEIRTPMTLIAAPLQQLIDNDANETRQRLYRIMQGASQRILTIITQILDLRKIDRGLLQMQMRPTNLVNLTRDVCSLFEAKAAEHAIALHIDDQTNGCEVWVDQSHFDKVIMNLLSNAFKFTPDGGNVGVLLRRTEREAVITVWDDGQSIAPENLDRVFERFFQEDNSINKAQAGTGIGLNLARQLVQLHHGTIEAKSGCPELEQDMATADGRGGVSFVVTLPLGCEHLSDSEKADDDDAEAADVAAVEETQTEQKDKAASSKKNTVIVVEDDEEIRQYLVHELSSTYHVVACSDGRQALSEALRQPPSIVLSDVMMPVMDGYTLCARLKSNSSTNFVPVVLLTAKTSEADKLEGLGHGADAYIEKPFNIDIVRHTVRNLIAAHDLLRNKMAGNEVPVDRIDEVRLSTPDELLLERITRVVNAHINDPHLSVEQIADEVGISRTHLHRKMKELTNLGPRDWVRNLRLQRAAQLLRQGHHNIAQVMRACGFDNQSSFTTKFKAQFGVTPTAYMKEANN